MKIAYGEGMILAVLVPVVIYLLGALSLPRTAFLFFVLAGAWTIVSAFAFGKNTERLLYVAWGLILAILASLSSYFVIQLQYAVALTIVAVIASILTNIASRRNNSAKPKDLKKNPETNPPSSV
jgi:hypothetical protein